MFEHTALQLPEYRGCRTDRTRYRFHNRFTRADFAEGFAASGNQRTNAGNEATDSFCSAAQK
jgi:hypothetical protein